MKTKLSFLFSFFILLSFFASSMSNIDASYTIDKYPIVHFEGVPFRLILVDADTNLDIYELRDGLEIDIDQIRNRNLNIRVDLDIPEQSSNIMRVDFTLDGPLKVEQSEFVLPFAAFGDIDSNYNGQALPEGSYTLFVGVDDDPIKDQFYWDQQQINFSVGKFKLKFSELLQIFPEDNFVQGPPVENGTILSYANNPMSFEAQPGSFKIGSAHFELTGQVSHSRIENVEPFTLFGDNQEKYNGLFLPEGNYVLTVTPYSGSNKQGVKGIPKTINFTIEFFKDDFTLPMVANLYDANTDKSIANLFTYNKAVFDKKNMNLDNVNLVVNPFSFIHSIKSVYMALQGPVSNFNNYVAPPFTKIENVAPFALFGDVDGDFYGESLSVGNYKLYATPYAGNNATGNAGFGRVFEFEIIDTSTSFTSKTMIYPNPANKMTLVKTEGKTAIFKTVVLDLTGKIVKDYSKSIDSEQAIDVSGLKKGIYVVQIFTGNERITKKLLVQ